MAIAHAPLAMSGEQFQYWANLFLTSQVRNLRHAEVESAKTLIDGRDGSKRLHTAAYMYVNPQSCGWHRLIQQSHGRISENRLATFFVVCGDINSTRRRRK